MTDDVRPLGVIAGAGRLPVVLTQVMQGARPLAIVSISNEPRPELSAAAHVFRHLSVGKIHEMLRVFDAAGATELVILGAVGKDVLFRPKQLDWLALKILAQAKTRGSQSLFRAIADEFGARGFTVADQRTYLPPLVATAGALTKGKPGRALRRDAEHALRLAREVARLDIGQAVAVKDGVPVAVEAMEGTDAVIRRAADLAGAGIVVAKAARPDHDFRFDVPTVGPDTIDALVEVDAAALAVEADRTFVLDRQELVERADANGLVIVAAT
ncbi:UDP-2,3-diacylglucosamine diphosphatase LpxI [Candidatus Poribacteria bacterium]|nr:UDP-2,3-diacylglucosamine diphosphatase LpxI [Candidatus Poribacteria bacterium]MBT5715010.1 UDP-2,3-diacylglucosamine diphosphatase LpxI [Candidatus Poribacteria bacterium]MBT7100994.1 UDP-2,3-diacylglucosamine diphosphatase LpxI [Candidatus Poribacteria bacterium]MBT7809177.1 UDP-2,3-diacylglucosamine diphosphatase LpxI [Candidatus Poribacteria bacterium]